MTKTLVYVFIFFGLGSCAVPCPRDKKAGEIALSAEARSFIPLGEHISPLTFVNADGVSKVFVSNPKDVDTKAKIPIEILCERGDFLDKTTQIQYIEVPSVHLFYTDNEQKYTLALDVSIKNIGSKSLADTVFVDDVSAWVQKLDGPSQNGSMSYCPSVRGRGNNVDVIRYLESVDFRIIADTTILGKRLTNVYTNASPSENVRVFLSKGQNIQAFTTKDGEVWVRK